MSTTVPAARRRASALPAYALAARPGRTLPRVPLQPAEPRSSGSRSTGLPATLGLRERLGRGAAAEVYRAVDSAGGPDVAVKIGFHRPEGQPDRLLHEAAVLASLQHPAIISFITAGTISGGPHHGRPFLVQELAHGSSLAAAAQAGGHHPAEVARWSADLFGALAHLHAGGLVHRDIKPANLMLSGLRRSPVRIIDFGIAAAAGSAAELGISSGTVHYMSPEQAAGANTRPSWDVYSMGLVLLEVLTGTKAFPGTAIESLVARTLRDPEVPAVLGPEWGAFLRSLTAMDSAARPTAAEAADAAARLGRPVP
ncbi:serine/threonine-protein kinase [Arthrobacter sp. ZBG10]|uniref:serine/threonine-protein kinase n=1 Tax=Arthrobacter sp. ZBG10 TaxID=1676590 RepID=UPI001E347FB5|nr:serine/threonine-protein kinase [Arthrobacter sp. ZBG10]